MKKIIFLLLFANIAFTNIPLIGNDFLTEYPFDKKIDEMSKTELDIYNFYNGYIEGWIGGKKWTLTHMMKIDNQKDIKSKSMVILLKKYLDKNPSKRYRELYLLMGDILSKE